MSRPPEPVTRTPRTASAGHDGEELVEQGARGLARAALDAPVARDQDGTLAGQRTDPTAAAWKRSGAWAARRGQEVAFVSLADQRGLEADAADVYAQKRHTGVCSDLPRDPYESPV